MAKKKVSAKKVESRTSKSRTRAGRARGARRAATPKDPGKGGRRTDSGRKGGGKRTVTQKNADGGKPGARTAGGAVQGKKSGSTGAKSAPPAKARKKRPKEEVKRLAAKIAAGKAAKRQAQTAKKAESPAKPEKEKKPAPKPARLRSQPVEVQEIDVPTAVRRKTRLKNYRPRSYGTKPKKVTAAKLVAVLNQYMGKVPRPPQKKSPKTVVETGIFAILAIGGNAAGECMDAVHRLLEAFPDWNEFRISDAIEFYELLAETKIDNLYDRCQRILDFVNDVYQDQNAVDLEFLRDLEPQDRLQILDRYPSLGPPLAYFIALSLQNYEGVLFNYSWARVAQRVGLVPRSGSPKVLTASLEKALKGLDSVSAQINMLELGEEVCHSKNPLCRSCYLVLMCKDRKV